MKNGFRWLMWSNIPKEWEMGGAVYYWRLGPLISLPFWINQILYALGFRDWAGVRFWGSVSLGLIAAAIMCWGTVLFFSVRPEPKGNRE